MSLRSTQRFGSRVGNYARYRPSYPPALLDHLRTDCDLSETSVIADIGSGTGILAEMFLDNGNIVYGVEPNPEMREAGERLLRRYPSFYSVEGTAEATTLNARCAGFVTAGQAFHWFDRGKARSEFRRILEPEGWVVLVWNVKDDTTPFGRDYEKLLTVYGTDYKLVDHRRIDAPVLREFFRGEYRSRTVDNAQRLDLDGLKGRLLSSSYIPEADHPRHEDMMAAVADIFETHARDGRVILEYDTNIHYGHLH